MLVRRILAAGALLMLAACSNPTAPTDFEIAQQAADEQDQRSSEENRGQQGGGQDLEK